MILALRTDSSTTQLVIFEPFSKELDSEKWQSGRQLSDQLLARAADLLVRNDLGWKDLSGLIVFRGPGSFTGLRIGATVANAIAFAQAIPIVGTSGPDWLKQGLAQLKAGRDDKQVIPEYGAPPNITKPRSTSA